MTTASETPGWDAIDGALLKIYGDQNPQHFGTVRRFDEGGPDPLDGLSIYTQDDHYHYVGYGLSELYVKESDNPERSGWGIELTFRLKRDGQAEAPQWPLTMLQRLARMIWKDRQLFRDGDAADAGPLGGQATAITAIGFTADPQLGTIQTPHGELTFLQVVGLTRAEFEAASVSREATWQVLANLKASNPYLVTDLSRV